GGAGQSGAGSGLGGYVVIENNDIPVPNGAQRRGVANCPTGLVPLGGAVNMLSGSTHANINSSFPTPAGWVGDVNNGSGLDAIFQVAVICGKRPRRGQIVQSGLVPNEAGNQTLVQARCPKGTTPLSGGAASSSVDLRVNLHSSIPSGDSWFATESNASGADASVISSAVCARFREVVT